MKNADLFLSAALPFADVDGFEPDARMPYAELPQLCPHCGWPEDDCVEQQHCVRGKRGHIIQERRRAAYEREMSAYLNAEIDAMNRNGAQP